MKRHVVIIGAGLGGLAAGLRLISNGYSVTFLEKNGQAGGRLNQLKRDGFTFDLGPSFFSMPYEFEDLAKDCNMEIPFEFVELDPLYTVHFRDGRAPFYLYKDIDKMSAQFDGIESNFKEKFTCYLKKCEALYNDTVGIVIKQNFNHLLDYLWALSKVNKRHLPLLLRTFWQQVHRYFESNEARQIISLISFFLGKTPFNTNGVYTLLSHIEFQNTGYYNVKGGMYTMVESLVSELKKRGAIFHYHTEITNFENKGNVLYHVIDINGKAWHGDLFLINGDAAYFRGKVLQRRRYQERRLKKKDWTMGYLTFYIGIKGKLPQIEHHNYFLGNNFESYSRMVTNQLSHTEKPYYYVNVISKHNAGCAPEGCEALFFVCPVPNLLQKSDWSDKEAVVDSILADFSKRIGYDINPHIVLRAAYSPIDWRDHFHLYQGAGLGLSHSLFQVGALRPSNRDEQFVNTFYVGASTVPGAGLPMAVISAKLVVERMLKCKI